MVQRTGGFRRKTRSKLRKNVRARGKVSVNKMLQTFKEGERVDFVFEPSIQNGMPLPKYLGHSGIIKNKQGHCYKVEVKDGKMLKTLLVHPVHLRGVK